jgi:hypothetical protein
MKHKVTRKINPNNRDSVIAECVCGWFDSRSKWNCYTTSMQAVRRELRYLVEDHLTEAKEVK